MTDLTIKQEKFAQKYVELGNASEAYRQAYDAENMSQESIWVEASRLMDNPNVSLRIKNLAQTVLKRREVTVDSLVDELDEIKGLATADKQYSPAVSAVMGKAKLTGKLIEKAELTGKDGAPLIPESSPKEIARRVAFLLAQGLEEPKS